MLADADQWSFDRPVESDVCIVGGGAAGIILALELERQGVSVCILESGGAAGEFDTQALYSGDNTGLDYLPLDSSRLRFWGGSTNHWTGWTRPLDEVDFEKRDWIPHSGWPIDRNTLTPYYEAAQRYFQIGYHLWSPSYWQRRFNGLYIDTGDSIETGIVRHSPPTRFGTVWGPAVVQSPRILAVLHANVTDIHTNAAGTAVEHISATTLSGKQLTAKARHYVLATGGIENARILLNNRAQHENGLGNAHDQVGRYFADHRGAVFGDFILASQTERLGLYTTRAFKDSSGNTQFVLTSGFRMSDAFQRSNGTANFGAVVASAPQPIDTETASPLADPSKARIFRLVASVEPLPNPASRVTLSDQTDALGTQRVNLDFQLGAQWHTAVSHAAQVFSRAWGAAGLGSARINESHDMPDDNMGYGSHHMGTTRMSDNPRNGVVNSDCRIHGMNNLYVAGSSVFPTFGYAQPTFTIGALAIRLAEHISERMT